MILIQNTLVSLDIIEKNFCCDIEKCKGACCIEGDSGAPLEKGEITEIKKDLPAIWKYLMPEAKKIITAQGISFKDKDGDDVTSLINNKNCVFSCYNNDICICSFEKAKRNGEITFVKPSSCHLFPIRLSKAGEYTAVNYQELDICSDAVKLGNKLNLPLYKFLKEPLINKFGEKWYEELCRTAKEWMACKK